MIVSASIFGLARLFFMISDIHNSDLVIAFGHAM
jgi:hypothetical protein